jgi:hypothetical protein
VATRKISDLTLLGAGEVSSSDTLLLLDNSDPTDQNKRSAVGSIFTAVPSGSYTLPGVRFEGKTSTGVFSETQGQVGLAMGNARLNLQKVGTTLNIQAKDDADQNLDFTISAQGTGKIRLGSVLAISDLNFIIPNSIDETKVARFTTANLTAGITNVYSFPDNVGLDNATDQLVTTQATQSLSNKTLVSASFSGTLSIESFTSSGNATIGSDAADSLTVNAGSTFASSATFANTAVFQSGFTAADMTANSLSLVDNGTGGNVLTVATDDQNTYGFVLVNDTYKVSAPTGIKLSQYDNGEGEFLLRGNTSATDGLPFKIRQVSGGSLQWDTITIATTGAVGLGYGGVQKVTTTNTGISIGGAIDAVTSITGSGDIAIATDKFTLDSATGNAVFGGNITGGGDINATTGTTFQLGSSASAKLGIGRAAATYNLEVEGSIYSTGSTIIAGNGSAGKFILQKGVGGIGLHFTDNTGTDQMVLNSAGNLGIGKNPNYRLDVSGNSWIDGDVTINSTNPAAGVGGTVYARQVVLTNQQTGASAILDASTAGGVSRGRVFFHKS